MEQKEFTIGKYTFRPRKLRPAELLAFNMTIDFDDYEKSAKMFDKIMEAIEVKIVESWQPLKAKGMESYLPAGIEDDMSTLMEVATYFMTNILKPIFQSSTESK